MLLKVHSGNYVVVARSSHYTADVAVRRQRGDYRRRVQVDLAIAGDISGGNLLGFLSFVVSPPMRLQTHLNAAARPGSSSAAIKPRISAIISSCTVGTFSYCMSHCRSEGGNIPSDWNSIPVGNEKCISTVKYQVVRDTSLPSV